MSDEPVGCAKPTGKVIGESQSEVKESKISEEIGTYKMVTVRVGGKAPDFEAPAYHQGKFINIKLSDYIGKWVVMCFYPGDFTFV